LYYLTLTLQTTVKYVILHLKADNKGEGSFSCIRWLGGKENGLCRNDRRCSAFSRWYDNATRITVTAAVEGLITFRFYMVSAKKQS
jgi:K+ transporter